MLFFFRFKRYINRTTLTLGIKMKGKTPHYRPRVIKRYNHRGELVDYGMLELGIVSGIRCVASKETLLLIGAGLTKQRVPNYFHTKDYINVASKGKVFKVYCIKCTEVSPLTQRLSKRERVERTVIVDDLHGNPVMKETWVKGERLSSGTTPNPITHQEDNPPRKESKVTEQCKKALLIIKKFFSSPQIKRN